MSGGWWTRGRVWICALAVVAVLVIAGVINYVHFENTEHRFAPVPVGAPTTDPAPPAPSSSTPAPFPSYDVQAVKQDEQELQQNVSTLPVSMLQGDAQTVAHDLVTVQGDLASGQGEQCSNVYSAQSDADTASSDLASMGSDAESFQADVDQIAQDERALLSTGAPQSVIGSYLESAKTTVNGDVIVVNDDVQDANSNAAQAVRVADASATGSCSSVGVASPPTPVGRITP